MNGGYPAAGTPPGPPGGTGGHAPADEPARPRHDAPEREGDPSVRTENELVRDIAQRVAGCPDVAELSGGPFGTIATYLPGGRVRGVALRDDGLEIAVTARYGTPLPEVADRIREAVGQAAGGRPVNVTIDDLQMST
ncbi:hypothetical protein [Spongiactinospora sp. 9N601]|uniref:hypothetical protein n=1 Tax=Spongiactinospora sp. 9N601 TaxID=3375149 RepID=UPI0037B7ED47